MKRVAQLALLALCFAPLPVHAFPFTTFLRILPRLPADTTNAERVHRTVRPRSSLDFVLSTFDQPIIGKFREAWQRTGNGTLPRESVVLILRMADGSFSARMLNPTNEYKRFTFTWHPATIAIVHTHPNNSSPRPEDDQSVRGPELERRRGMAKNSRAAGQPLNAERAMKLINRSGQLITRIAALVPNLFTAARPQPKLMDALAERVCSLN